MFLCYSPCSLECFKIAAVSSSQSSVNSESPVWSAFILSKESRINLTPNLGGMWTWFVISCASYFRTSSTMKSGIGFRL